MGGVGKIKKKLFVFNQALASDQDSEVDVTNCTFPHEIDKKGKRASNWAAKDNSTLHPQA